MKKIRTKISNADGSQTARLPKEFRFDEPEVMVHRQGRRVILEPIDEWPDTFRAILGAWPEDIPRPKQRQLTDTPDPFE